MIGLNVFLLATRFLLILDLMNWIRLLDVLLLFALTSIHTLNLLGSILPFWGAPLLHLFTSGIAFGLIGFLDCIRFMDHNNLASLVAFRPCLLNRPWFNHQLKSAA